MLYAKNFKLQPYWNKFVEKVDKYRESTFAQGIRQRPTLKYLVDDKEWMFGGSTFIVPPDRVNLFIKEDLEKVYHKANLALKIFYFCPQPLGTKLFNYRWGKSSNLMDASKIQNVFAKGGYAPYIIDLVSLIADDCKYSAQVTEYIDHESSFDILKEDSEEYQTLVKYAYDNRITMFDVLEGQNFTNGKLVDFEYFSFNNNKENYHDLINATAGGLSFGGDSIIPYQSIEELNLRGRRSNLAREKFFRLKEDVRNGSTALDIGCNGAYFLRRAMDYGATYTVGVDIPGVTDAAFTINNYLGYFNMDFVNQLPDEKFDIVFYLSATGYGINDIDVFSKVGEVLYFEGHGGQNEKMCREILEPHFRKVEVLGYVNDYPESGERILIRCELP